MSSSDPETIQLSLRDGSFVTARIFENFVLLRRRSETAKDMAELGQRIFDQQFGFVSEVIATEVEICMAIDAGVEPADLRQIESVDLASSAKRLSQHHQLPILIDEQHADWKSISAHTKLTQTQYLKRLFDCQLSVAMTGFLPGFVYLQGLPEELHVPRKSKPATHTAAGTFALGGSYAGIYSLPSAAGWNCIGTIAKQLFCQHTLPPTTLAAGDTIELRRIDAAEFDTLRKEVDRSGEHSAPAAPKEPDGRLRFEHPGLFSLVQDRGRRGYAWYAIPRGGPMDAASAELANVILGQDAANPVLEFHFLAPKIRFLSNADICLTGADMRWQVNGSPAKRGRTLSVAGGDLLSGSSAKEGCRGYMAIRGQIETQRSFASAATYVAAKFGGNGGRAFAAGDELGWQQPTEELFPLQIKIETGRVAGTISWQPGPEFSQLDQKSREAIFGDAFCIAAQSDRMGARLNGPRLSAKGTGQLSASVPLLPGMVQLTPAGQLIVVLQDGQTTGGYPRVGYLNRRSIEQLSQTKIGNTFGFRSENSG